jgi:adenylate cyclase class IV
MFEVEIRCHFDSLESVHDSLSLFSSCLQHEMIWDSSIYGLGLFKSGRVLRISSVIIDTEAKNYLCLKEKDIGEFANIRQETEEDITNGITNSEILKTLGGAENLKTCGEIIREVEHLGYPPFMSYRGKNLSGYYEPFDIHLKLMHCQVLKWPLLLELEKMAKTEADAKQSESELRELCRLFRLTDRLVKEEPPTLLYNAIFNRGSTGI